ncbi:pectinesterase family protein [Hymenobacter sp. H14-R3]|uniref:pectinesterase family protein n=1 Tax=Hymenobacter sp. H14-R3 TaxID=3046308 RepID=UPI0024B918B5|nr:pectinesterase family protein [Hymenobacter sp. H14-R3]MDJ0364233.1 pectinesterase family protein [Hymenobacter sp. H14-R3]
MPATGLGMPPARPPPPPQVLLLRVAQNGSGDHRTMEVKNGMYREKLGVRAHKTHVRLVGESAAGPVITGRDHTADAAGHQVLRGRPWGHIPAPCIWAAHQPRTSCPPATAAGALLPTGAPRTRLIGRLPAPVPAPRAGSTGRISSLPPKPSATR